MDIFFITKQQYSVNDSIDNVRANIESLIKRRWYDFSINITGRFTNTSTFIITPKWSLTIIRWFESDITYLKGILSSEGNKTTIETTLRPNSLLVILFYFFIIMSFLEPLGISHLIEKPSIFKFLFFPLFSLIIGLIIIISKIMMKLRFERLLNLKQGQ